MIRYECDRCGAKLQPNDPARFIVKLEVYAAAGPVDLPAEDLQETRAKLDRLLDRLREADPDDIEDRTYRSFRFDVCDACRKALLQRPLG